MEKLGGDFFLFGGDAVGGDGLLYICDVGGDDFLVVLIHDDDDSMGGPIHDDDDTDGGAFGGPVNE